MSSLEVELQDLREKNNELVKKVQEWKMTAAQRENEKLDLMKENSELRLKLSKLRSGGAAHAQKLDTEIQTASKQALSHLVQASSAVTRTVQLAKTFIQEMQELEAELPRWSSISNTPSNEKVHRVLPMLIGGQSLQPVVSLSRTMVNLNNTRNNRSPNNNQNRNYHQRALPMHLLQDLYIPLTRIDANGLPMSGMEVDPEAADGNNSAEDLGLDDTDDQESPNVNDSEQFNDPLGLDAVAEELEPEEEGQPTAKTSTENPLEGPSWMLDALNKNPSSVSGSNLEPDSTTEFDNPSTTDRQPPSTRKCAGGEISRMETGAPFEFSPTVRRRKRASSPVPQTPPYSSRPPARRNSNNGRILKVLVSKLRLDDDDATPPKRPTLGSSPEKVARSPRVPKLVRAKRHSTEGSPRVQRRAGGHSPHGSPTRRHARAGSQKQRSRSRDRSPIRRLSREGSPARKAREKSPLAHLSRDVHLMSFDAPSPNGATTSHVVVSDAIIPLEAGGAGDAVTTRRTGKRVRRASLAGSDARPGSRGSRVDSDSGSGSEAAGEGRTRRVRKVVVYKEKPLNSKMRR